MNITLPAPAATSSSTLRTILASMLNVVLKHTRPLDGNETTFAAPVAAKPAGAVARTIAKLSETSEARAMRLQDAYLSEATDIYDLEFRSREWDRKANTSANWA